MSDPVRPPLAGLRRLFAHARAAALVVAGLALLAGCGPKEPVELPDRVLVIAVESLSVDQIDRMLADGDLPVLSRMIAQGARASAVAPDPLDPQMLWATATTGKKASVHQMMGELVNLPSGRRSLPPSSMRQAKTFLQVASDAGKTVVSVGMPGTWPAEVVNGVVVAPTFVPSRWTETTEHTFDQWVPQMNVYPFAVAKDLAPMIRSIDDLPRETASRFFRLNETEYRMLYDDPLGSIYHLENPVKDVGLTIQRDASFVDMLEFLSDRYVPQIAAIHLELLDPVQRMYWPFQRPEIYTTPADSRRRFRNTVKVAYQHVDQQIGELVAGLPENATVVVVGDRGFGDAPDPTNPDTEGPVPQPLNRTLMLFWGHGIERGVDLGTVAIEDLTPTVLRLAGVHVGSDMDGRVLVDAITDDFEAAHPLRTVASHDEEWDQKARYPEGADTATPDDADPAGSETP